MELGSRNLHEKSKPGTMLCWTGRRIVGYFFKGQFRRISRRSDCKEKSKGEGCKPSEKAKASGDRVEKQGGIRRL